MERLDTSTDHADTDRSLRSIKIIRPSHEYIDEGSGDSSTQVAATNSMTPISHTTSIRDMNSPTYLGCALANHVNPVTPDTKPIIPTPSQMATPTSPAVKSETHTTATIHHANFTSRSPIPAAQSANLIISGGSSTAAVGTMVPRTAANLKTVAKEPKLPLFFKVGSINVDLNADVLAKQTFEVFSIFEPWYLMETT